MKKFQLPYGVQDYLPEECRNKDLIEGKLAETFRAYGYEKVQTATLEYYDLFEGVLPAGGINKLFKMTDGDGSLLVLRPDPTLQICRMALSKLDLSRANRLYYIENSFEYLPDASSARSREFAQVGVELLGKSGADGDAEIVITAIEALKNAGLDDFLIDVGHAGFLCAVAQEYGLNANDLPRVKEFLNGKDESGLERFLTEKGYGGAVVRAFKSLCSLYGGGEMLKNARNLCKIGGGAAAIVERLEQILLTVSAYGYEKYVSFDLGMPHGGYYSGIVIRGITEDLGVSVLDGGRYDALGERFGASLEAVGFAIGVKRLLLALDKRGKLSAGGAPCDAAYISVGAVTKAEVDTVRSLRKGGKRVVRLFGKDKAGLLEYCRKNGIGAAFVFGEKGSECVAFDTGNSVGEVKSKK